MRTRQYRKRSSDYLLPFLILVGIGVIGVLGFQLWSSFQGKLGDVYFYVVSGKAKMLQYGTSEWSPAFSGTKLLLGDQLKTANDSKLVLKFYNGTTVRFDQNTQVTLVDVNRRSDEEKIALALDYGSLWVNKVASDNIQSSRLEVRTPHMLVKDVGTVFNVESGNGEAVRVFKGLVKVDVMADDNNKNQVFDSMDVGVGQEMDLDQASLKAFKEHQSPSVLIAIRDDFRSSAWYSWNVQEDEKPTDYAVAGQSSGVSVAASGVTQSAIGGQNSSDQAGAVSVSNPSINASAVVNQPAGSQVPSGSLIITIQKPAQKQVTVNDGKLLVSGSVSVGTAKIMVRQTLLGVTEEYTLQKFKAGDLTFSYSLSEAYGNLKEGDNTYSFFGVDANGKRSDEETTLKVKYNKSVDVSTAPVSAPLSSDPALTPKVLSFNGAASSEVTVGVVKVIGEVHGADKVVVSGLTLKKFKPGSTQWIYFANENGGNLKPGKNEYEAYAIDASGKESGRVKFTITYNKPAAQ